MKWNKARRTIILGLLCAALAAASSWYTITYNDARLFVPMDFSEYVFRVQDLPMIISIALLCVYVLYLFALLIRAVIATKRAGAAAQSTRAISPKLGFLGFLGFAGFSGFWTYHVDKSIFPFMFFSFFGFFGFFYEGKMSNTFMDERYRENSLKAHLTANKIALAVIFLAVLILGQGKLMGNLEYTLIALVIVIALSIALEVFLYDYLLYRYDHEGESEESGE